MLNFIIGSKGSGKTTKAHLILGEAVRRGEQAVLVVPKQFTFESDKSILRLLGPKDACEVEVLSFSRLAAVVMQTYGGITLPIAKKGARSVLMSLAIESLTEKLTVFAKHKNEISLVVKMLDTLDEMKKQGISVSDLEKTAFEAEDNLLKEKTLETALIIRAYEAITAQNYFDDSNLLSFVADTLKGKDFFKDKTVVLDGFAYFTSPEFEIIRTMLLTAKEVYISLCTDKINDTDELSAFALCNRTARKLRLIAGNDGISLGEVICCTRNEDEYSPELSHFEKELYKSLPVTYNDRCSDISVSCASDISAECDLAARKIKKLLREGRYRCRDIALCFRNGESYESHIRYALKKYGVPLFEDKRQAVENQPLVSFVSVLLMIAARGINSDSMFRLFKTGLTGYSCEEIALIENYCFMWDITGKQWLTDFTENPDGFGEKMTEERKSLLHRLNSLRKSAVTPLIRFREELEGKNGKEAAELIYRYLRENEIDENLKSYAVSLEERGLTELALEQEQVWDLLMESLDELACALGESTVTAERLSELFSLVINTKSLGKLPDGFDEVLICKADRMLTNNARVVFVLGLNGGVFPATVSETGLFSRREKDKLRKNGLEIGEELTVSVARERFLLYNALSSAKEKLFLSFCVTGNGGEKLTKSEAIDSALQIFPKLSIETETDANPLELIESEASAFEVMGKRWQENSAFVNTLKEHFSQDEAYASRFSAIKRATDEENFAFENGDNALELFGKQMSFSASKLEDYGKCPFLFFCRYGLKAKPRLKARLDASQSGTVIHHVLEVLLKRYKGKEFLDLSDEKLKMEIGTILSSYLEDSMGSGESKTERFNYLYYRTGKILEHIMLRLRAEFCESDFEPCAFELRIGKGADVEPMVYTLEKGTAELYGFIDRVDSLDLDGKRYIRIVDYKSGDKKFRLSDVLCGMNMQMLLYLVSIWRNGKGFYENITPAGVLYFPARISPCTAERGESDEERFENRLASGQMNGLLVNDGAVISHMEKELRGVFIPAKLDKKTQQLKGDFISVKQLESLAERMDKIIIEMGNSLQRGLIPAEPAFGSYYTEVCSWCDYSDICLKENPTCRLVVKKDHKDCLELLSGGEKGEEKLD